jgi:tRNA pseudouridine13 synthase
MLRLSKGKRATGSIKSSPEDFKVEEITQNGTILKLDTKYTPAELGLEEKEGEFAMFVMQKYNWNTTQALQNVAQKVHRGIKSTGFAGTKDKTAQSTQLCSIFGADLELLRSINLKDVKINGAWKSDKKMELGMLSGNHFTITIQNAKDFEQTAKNVADLNGIFPNYFGAQRFGSRKNNHEIGLSILKGDFQSAAMQFLTDTNNEINDEAREARSRLADDHDFTAALDYFPTYLKYERTILDYLSKSERNFANAIKRLPRSLTLMLIHSVEDHIFNAELESLIKEGRVSPQNGDVVCAPDEKRFYRLSDSWKYEKGGRDGLMVGNVLGYETKEPTEFEKEELDKLGLKLDAFKVKGMPELNSKGTTRVLFAPFRDFEIGSVADNPTLSFSLPSGSYATVFLEELIEPKEEITDKDKYD